MRLPTGLRLQAQTRAASVAMSRSGATAKSRNAVPRALAGIDKPVRPKALYCI